MNMHEKNMKIMDKVAKWEIAQAEMRNKKALQEHIACRYIIEKYGTEGKKYSEKNMKTLTTDQIFRILKFIHVYDGTKDFTIGETIKLIKEKKEGLYVDIKPWDFVKIRKN